MLPQTRSVTIGAGTDDEQAIKLAPFRAFKAFLAGRLISRVTGELDELAKADSAYIADYRRQNTVRIDRDMCLERIHDSRAGAETARRLVDDAPEEPPEAEDGLRRKTQAELEADAAMFDERAARWQHQLDDLGDRPYIELPRDPSDEERILHAFKDAFEMEREVMQFLAIVAIPNAELKKSWRQDTVFELLDDRGAEILEVADLGEIVQLLVDALELAQEQLAPFREAVGKARRLFSRNGQAEATDPQETPLSPSTPTPSQPPSETPPAETASSPTETTDHPGPEASSSVDSTTTTSSPSSSDASPAPTDGDPGGSSSGSRGDSSALSVPA